MRKQATSRYIWFGGVVQYLRYVGEQTTIHGEDVILGNFARLKRDLDKLELSVSRQLVKTSGLQKLLDELSEEPEDAKLTHHQAGRLTDLMAQLSDTIMAESSQKSAYVVASKRWDTTKLLDAPGELFSPGVYDKLDPEIQQDLKEACRCIAFELPTAAAFHLMRATEALVRMFYLATVKRGQLDHIRINFRNPTQHPDAVYDVQSAQDLFGVCIDAIHRTMREVDP